MAISQITSASIATNTIGANNIGTLDSLIIANTVTAGAFSGPVTGNLTGTVQTAAQPNITSTGALTVPSLGVDGDITADDVTANSFIGTISTAAQPNITSLGTVTSLTSSGDIESDTFTVSSNGSINDSQYRIVTVTLTSNSQVNLQGANGDYYIVDCGTHNITAFGIEAPGLGKVQTYLVELINAGNNLVGIAGIRTHNDQLPEFTAGGRDLIAIVKDKSSGNNVSLFVIANDLQ